MALEAVVDALEKVPEAARSFYVQRDGKFHLDLSGAPSGYIAAADHNAVVAKVAEFRDKNIALLQEVEPLRAIKTELGDITPKAAKDAVAKVTELAARGVSAAGDVAAQISAAVKAAVEPLRSEVETFRTSAQNEKKRADEQTLHNIINDRFVKAGGNPKAIDFVIERAKSVFQVEDGAVKAQPNKFSSQKPGELLSVDEWLTSLTKDADFAFKPSAGSGAPPANGSGARPGAKPGQTILKDPTPQQLGEYASDIKAGKVRIEYTNA
jgi:hypothetical protein